MPEELVVAPHEQARLDEPVLGPRDARRGQEHGAHGRHAGRKKPRGPSGAEQEGAGSIRLSHRGVKP
jgi:hypothetical protein